MSDKQRTDTHDRFGFEHSLGPARTRREASEAPAPLCVAGVGTGEGATLSFTLPAAGERDE